jgi:hypothetical protein
MLVGNVLEIFDWNFLFLIVPFLVFVKFGAHATKQLGFYFATQAAAEHDSIWISFHYIWNIFSHRLFTSTMSIGHEDHYLLETKGLCFY